MNDHKLKKLFSAARGETPPAPPSDFDAAVFRAIHLEGAPSRGPVSVIDQLNALFPKIAWAALIVICMCVAGEMLSSATSPGLDDGIAQISDQWLFTGKGF